MPLRHSEAKVDTPALPIENGAAPAATQTSGIEASKTETQARRESARRSALENQVTASIRRDVRSLRWRSLRYAIVVACLPLSVTLIIALQKIWNTVNYSPDMHKLEIPDYIGSIAFACLSLYTIVFLVRSSGKNRLKIIDKIGVTDDIQLVGPLVDILAIGSKQEHTIAKEALTRLLPKLKASDAALLTHAQRRQLDRCLIPRRYNSSKTEQQRDTDFQLAILVGYEQVGDIDSWSAVWALAYPSTDHRLNVPPKVSAEAQRCLQFLEYLAAHQRFAIEQYRISSQLLRPSSASNVSQEMLLHPAMQQTNPEESASLLRATNEGVSSPAVSGKRAE